jgi:hypothetical protein
MHQNPVLVGGDVHKDHDGQWRKHYCHPAFSSPSDLLNKRKDVTRLLGT